MMEFAAVTPGVTWRLFISASATVAAEYCTRYHAYTFMGTRSYNPVATLWANVVL